MQNVLSREAQRADFVDWYRRNRARSAQLFGMIVPEAYYSRPIPLRHPIAFYEGHLPAFSFNTLVRNALGKPSIDARLEKLFQRGIDPADAQAAADQSIRTWPTREEILAFGRACDDAVMAALERVSGDAIDSLAVQAAYTILEHEPMHHETLLYIYHRVPYEHKIKPSNFAAAADAPAPRNTRVEIPAGTATLGVARGAVPFGWDNEFEETRVPVNAFQIDAHSVTNGDYAAFVRAGGPQPPFWEERGAKWFLKTMFEELPLPASWPVYVSRDHALAYADWKGGRLPTEAQYHRAAYGTPDGSERLEPWGASDLSEAHGNFDFRRWDPEPAGSHPGGASAWGVHDLVGNGWEWTDTPFRPLPGFRPMQTYPQYSADFFDEQHFVIKGASPVTARELVRRSFRNWFRSNYPYVYAKFRMVH